MNNEWWPVVVVGLAVVAVLVWAVWVEQRDHDRDDEP